MYLILNTIYYDYDKTVILGYRGIFPQVEKYDLLLTTVDTVKCAFYLIFITNQCGGLVQETRY